jgi:hypothetical protein
LGGSGTEKCDFQSEIFKYCVTSVSYKLLNVL